MERRIFLGVGDTQSGAGAENPPRLRVGLFHLPAAVPETDPQMPCSLAESLTCISDGKIRKVHPTLQKVQVGAGCRKREREMGEMSGLHLHHHNLFRLCLTQKLRPPKLSHSAISRR